MKFKQFFCWHIYKTIEVIDLNTVQRERAGAFYNRYNLYGTKEECIKCGKIKWGIFRSLVV